MTPNSDPSASESLRSGIQAQHPRIADEIQGAIDTLRKLQDIACTPEGGMPAGHAPGDPSATTDGTWGVLTPPARNASPHGTEAGEDEARTTPTLEASESFGRYQIVRLLGRGAMGAVYLAYDSHLQRHVAIKTPFLGSNRQTIERFHREARAAAQLRSPHLCPIYDVGQISGIYYLSMAFIDGQPLSRVIADRRLTEERAVAEVVKKVAQGLQKAHDQGIMHRDLKPDNIMLERDGEPIVMDFGLARRIDDDVRITTPGRIIGTPAYMSPEQVEGDPKKMGPATDIYSLGVVLYELLTGQLPFQGSLTSVLRQIGSAEPQPPSALRPELREGSPLERICLKMMAKSPMDRFATMAEVAQALEELHTPANIAAAPRPSLWRRLSGWVAGLFASRPRPAEHPQRGAAPSAPAAASSPDQTQAATGQVLPPGQQGRQSGDQTVDLPQSHGS